MAFTSVLAMLAPVLWSTVTGPLPWLLVAAAVVARLHFLRYQHGLHRFPGPLLASFTELWRVWSHVKDMGRLDYDELHATYGEVVRVAPRMLYISSPAAVKDIFYGKGFTKSEFYGVAAGVRDGTVVPNLFSTLDATWHYRLRRAVNGAFTLTALTEYEPAVDETVRLFLAAVAQHHHADGRDLDLPAWMLYYALDNIEQITFSARHGCIENGGDSSGVIAAMSGALLYVNTIGKAPFLDRLLLKNPFLLWLGRHGVLRARSIPTVPFAVKHLERRLAALSEGRAPARADLMSKFLAASDRDPAAVTLNAVLGMTLSAVNAGSDTTAASLAGLFYHLLRKPECLRKLREEVDRETPDEEARRPGEREQAVGRAEATFYAVPYAKAVAMPYLDACIKEGFRIHPGLPFPMERVTPPEGAHITISAPPPPPPPSSSSPSSPSSSSSSPSPNTIYVPGNVTVACNSWTIGRSKAVFGDDVDTFRPERWLAPDADPTRHKEMASTLLHFGAGKHTCIGKNIALLEIYKLVPSLLRAFDVELAHPEKKVRFKNFGFFGIEDMPVRLRRRQTASLRPRGASAREGNLKD